MIRASLEALVHRGLESLGWTQFADATVTEPRDPSHGDYATSVALQLAKPLGKAPRDIATELKQVILGLADESVSEIEVAGPGFLNFRLAPGVVATNVVNMVLAAGTGFAHGSPGTGERINVEFVSVNPNGPITVGSGRGAAVGSVLCNVLSAAGHIVHREFYVNDGINSEQMRLFAESVRALARGLEVPESGYKGDYVAAVAERIRPIAELEGWPSDLSWWQRKSQELMLAKQKADLEAFGVEFDTWFSEQSLHEDGSVERELSELMALGAADERPFRNQIKLGKGGVIEDVEQVPQEPGEGKTLWLRSTKFGDDMDRVLRRSDGRPTYISSDVAYHKDKFNRPPNADRLITVLGPDHHGYINRLHAVVGAVLESDTLADHSSMDSFDSRLFDSAEDASRCGAALAESRRRLYVLIFQIVRFLKDGEPAPMRKRDGNIYALIDLIDELGKAMAPEADLVEQQRIGRDVSRFFYLMRSHDTHMDFDIDLATKRSDENPVFYVQYAYARICSVLRKAAEAGLSSGETDLGLLVHPAELNLTKQISDLPWEVQRCAADYEIHRLTAYAQDLARCFHGFYDSCRVIALDQPDLSFARLSLCKAAQVAFRAVFELLGISAPETM